MREHVHRKAEAVFLYGKHKHYLIQVRVFVWGKL